MNKLILSLAALLLGGLTASAGANVYATGLKYEKAENGDYTFSYTLNVAATAVDILIYDANGNVAKTISSDGLVQGINTFTTQLPLEIGNYSWAVKATAESTEGQITAVATPKDMAAYPGTDLLWGRLRGVDVNNDPESEWFGNVYITGTPSSSGTYAGVLVLNSNMLDAVTNKTPGVPYAGGITWPGQSSPNDACVAESGNVFLADWSDKNSGVFVMDAADPSTDFTAVFSGVRAADGLISDNGLAVGGSTPTACVIGKDEDMHLYTWDEDYPDGGAILRYNLGASDLPWKVAPSKVLGKTFKLDGADVKVRVTRNARIRPDRNGGIWMCQRIDKDFPNDGGYASLLHFNAEDELDFWTDEFTTTNTGALAVNHDGSMIAVATPDGIKIFDVTFNEGNVPSIKAQGSVFELSNSNIFGIGFDYAMNIYAALSGSGIYVYALPKADNTCEVPANSFIEIKETSAIADVAAEGGLTYRDGVIRSAVPAVVYTAAGVKVAEGTEIAADALAGGVYIVRAGAETLKIVR